MGGYDGTGYLEEPKWIDLMERNTYNIELKGVFINNCMI
jgi:hypothetical protein